MFKPGLHVQVENHGSIAMITPMNAAAREWVEEHVATESWQWMGPSLAVDPRYVSELLEGMEAEGFTVEHPE